MLFRSLAAAGQDNNEHYQVKIDASQLILDHTEDTFVTPVFNGSASLRDAAGHLVEDVSKGARRKKTIDDAYLDQLFADTQQLYRLDQLETGEGGKRELGPLPRTASVLLGSLAIAWLLIGLYLLGGWLRKRG